MKFHPVSLQLFILEDDPLFQTMLKYLLKGDAELDLTFFEEGASCIARLRHQRPDIMILDYALPDIDGRQVLRAARSRYPDLPIIILSSTNAPDVIHQLFEDGAYDFIAKDSYTKPKLMRMLQHIKNYLRLKKENTLLKKRTGQ